MFKHSIYNNLIPITNKYSLLYNTYTNKYLLLSPILRSGIRSSVESLEKDYPVFYKQLIETGCLVDENEDEALRLAERVREVDENMSSYRLTINPTINCNFKCWYCYEEHRKTKMLPETLEAVKKFITAKTNSPELKEFHLSFFGGEPLLYYWPVVLPIMEHLNRCKQNRPELHTFVHFTTNGYLLDERMIASLKEQQAQSFQITLDGTREEHDQTRFPYKGGKSFDRIVRNVICLLENGFKVTLRLNYTSRNARRMQEIVPLFAGLAEEAKQNLTVDFQQVWQDRGSETEDTQAYIEACIDLFTMQKIRTTHKYHDYVRNSCYADKKNSAVINYDGKVYKCTARDFTPGNSEGYLSPEGEIVWDMEKYQLRRTIRFTRPQCRQCRIAPICGGACSQKHIEQQNSVRACLLGYDEQAKDEVLLDKFYADVVKPNL